LLNDRLDDPNTNALHLCRETADGLYWMLWEVSEELKYAANRMLLMILNNSFFFSLRENLGKEGYYAFVTTDSASELQHSGPLFFWLHS